MPLRKGGKHGFRFERPRTKRSGATRRSPRPTGVPYGLAGIVKALKKKSKSTIGKSKKKRQGRLAARARKVKFFGRRGKRKRMPRPRRA